jgi:hypothetical protein
MRAILTYHAIDATGSPVSCRPDAFERHLDWIRNGPVRATTIEDLVALPPSADAVAITFDDALVNFDDVAAPRLLDRGLPCTVFVVADRAGGTNDWGGRPARGVPRLRVLDWAALVRLQEQGIEIGSHSRTHPDLTALDGRSPHRRTALPARPSCARLARPKTSSGSHASTRSISRSPARSNRGARRPSIGTSRAAPGCGACAKSARPHGGRPPA